MTKLSDYYNVSYDITDELIIRKILEKSSNYKYEFSKNENVYGCDLKMYMYEPNGNEWSRSLVGMIEVEKALTWKGKNIPENWYCISFLKRKLFKYNWSGYEFMDVPKYNDLTFYLKFNKDYSNCFCQRMDVIVDKGKDSYRNTFDSYILESNYNGSYWEVNKEFVVFGINECIEFITNELKNHKATQQLNDDKIKVQNEIITLPTFAEEREDYATRNGDGGQFQLPF